MKQEFEDLPLIKAEKRFELAYNGHIAFIEYEERDGKILLIHTEAPDELRGTGAAAALVEKTFLWLEENGIEMIPFCPYIKSTLLRKPEWLRVVAEPHRSVMSN